MNHKLVIIMLFLLTVCFTSSALAMEGDENPIDKAFATEINQAVNTVWDELCSRKVYAGMEGGDG